METENVRSYPLPAVSVSGVEKRGGRGVRLRYTMRVGRGVMLVHAMPYHVMPWDWYLSNEGEGIKREKDLSVDIWRKQVESAGGDDRFSPAGKEMSATNVG